MNIDRVVLVWDGNPFYDGFYERHCALWGKLGIKTGLVFVSDGKNIALKPSIGDVVVVEDKSKVPFTPPPGRNWKATMAIIYGPTLFKDEVVMVTGMDQFPASMRFINAVAKVPDTDLATCIGSKRHITTNHVVAHNRVWSRSMSAAPADFTDLLEWTWQRKMDLSGYAGIATGWGSDEVLFAQLVQQCDWLTVQTIFKDYQTEWLDRVLGITQKVPDPQKLKDGWYSELHIRLPMSQLDRNTFNTLLSLEPFPGMIEND